MNKFKKFKSRTIHTQKSTNQPDDNFTQTIDGVKVTLGCDPDNLFNLSILGRLKPYQTNSRGFYDKSKPILDPLEWIKSDDGQKYLNKCCNNFAEILFTTGYQHIDKSPATIYTRDFYLWLGYLKHCIGNIATVISAESAN